MLLDRSEAYIGDAIRPLVNDGRLTFLYPDQPRHPRQKYMAATGVAIDLGPLEHPSPIDFVDEIDPLIPVPDRMGEERVRHPLPSHAPRVPDEREPPRFPNQATNLVYVIMVGVILGFTEISVWWLIAALAALALAWLHVARDSAQYQQFQGLQDFLNRRRAFLLAKSAVTCLEIIVVFLVVRLIVPTR